MVIFQTIPIVMLRMFCKTDAAVRVKYMAAEPRTLSLSFAGGGISSLILSLLRDWSHSTASPLPPLIEPVAQLISDCHCSWFETWDLSERELVCILIGILIG